MSVEQPVTAAAPVSKGKIFLRRLCSSILLWVVVLGALFSGNKLVSDYVFLAIMVLLVASGMIEFYGIVKGVGVFCFAKAGIFGGVLLIVATFFYISGQAGVVGRAGSVNDFENGVIILFVLGLCVRQFVSHASTKGIIAISTTLLGLMYVAWLLNFLQKINFFGRGVEGNFYLLYFILVTKLSDCGAYVVGSLIGRHKMIPRVSPRKTWEGFFGAIVVSTIASVLFALAAGKHLLGMTLVHAVILGVVLSISAVIGDLIESIFKREAGLKDSGKLFPGIGGILDLLDSLLFNAPLMYLYMRLFLIP